MGKTEQRDAKGNLIATGQQIAAAHEMGHQLGLNHVDDPEDDQKKRHRKDQGAYGENQAQFNDIMGGGMNVGTQQLDVKGAKGKITKHLHDDFQPFERAATRWGTDHLKKTPQLNKWVAK
jgi:hypothetical protein